MRNSLKKNHLRDFHATCPLMADVFSPLNISHIIKLFYNINILKLITTHLEKFILLLFLEIHIIDALRICSNFFQKDFLRLG